MNIFRYTFKLNDGTPSYGYINLDQVLHADIITKKIPVVEDGVEVLKEQTAVLLTFQLQVQRQMPEPIYASPTKEQRVSGQLPPIKDWRNVLVWTNYQIIITEPSEVENLKEIYSKVEK